VPPPPVHANENDVVVVSGPVDSDPDVAFAPAHPPLAEQVVACVLLQVSVVDDPDATVVLFAVMDTVGAGVTLEVDPSPAPPPPQDPTSKVASAARMPAASDPPLATPLIAGWAELAGPMVIPCTSSFALCLKSCSLFIFWVANTMYNGYDRRNRATIVLAETRRITIGVTFTLALSIGLPACSQSRDLAQQHADAAARIAAATETLRLQRESRDRAALERRAAMEAAAAAEEAYRRDLVRN
jgi:hypothetical protein